jgi:hypothetical protein
MRGVGSAVFPRCAVPEHPHFLQRDEAGHHHPVEHRQEGVDAVFVVDDLDDQRQVHQEVKDLAGMDPAVFPT